MFFYDWGMGFEIELVNSNSNQFLSLKIKPRIMWLTGLYEVKKLIQEF